MDEKKKVLLVAGMSGSGKTYYCQTLQKNAGALHNPVTVAYRSRDDLRREWVEKNHLPPETPYEDKYREPNKIYDDWLKAKMAGDDDLVLIEHPFHRPEMASRYTTWAKEQNRDVEMRLFFSTPEVLAERVLKRSCANIDELREKINNGEAEKYVRSVLSTARKLVQALPEYRASAEAGRLSLKVIDNTGFEYKEIADFGAGKSHIRDKLAYHVLEDYARLGNEHGFSFKATENAKAENGYGVKVTISNLPASLQMSTAAHSGDKIKGRG